MLDEVLRQIEQRDRFVLTSHARPDGDAVGSALACGEILRQMNKQVEVVLRLSVKVFETSENKQERSRIESSSQSGWKRSTFACWCA